MSKPVLSIDQLLAAVAEHDASDLHLTVGLAAGDPRQRPPRAPAGPRRADAGGDPARSIYRILSTEQQKMLETRRQIDFSHSIPGLARFRVNAYFQRASRRRRLPAHPGRGSRRSRSSACPTRLYELADKPRGLVLVTGPDRLGQVDDARVADRPHQPHAARAHPHDRGPDRVPAPPRDAASSTSARSARTRRRSPRPSRRAAPGPRRDPRRRDARPRDDRDRAHRRRDRATSCSRRCTPRARRPTIDRVIDVFPAEQQGQVRVQLASTLQGVVTQNLVPTADGLGRDGRARDPHARRRRPQPDPPGEDRADLLGHADEHLARHADDGAVARRPGAAPTSSRPRLPSRARRRPDQLRGLLERAGLTNLTSGAGNGASGDQTPA